MVALPQEDILGPPSRDTVEGHPRARDSWAGRAMSERLKPREWSQRIWGNIWKWEKWE